MDKYELFDKYLTGNLNNSESDALMALLKDEETGRELVEYSLETKLFVDYGKKVKSKISTPLKTGKYKKPRQRRSSLPILMIAAMLMLAFLGFQLFRENNKAEISKESFVEVIRGGVIASGEKGLQEGDSVRAVEDSEITFKDGSTLVLTAGAELQIQELVLNKVIFLSRGKVLINAMPQELGKLKVITSDSATEVIGTQFSVHKLSKGTLLEVLEGKVKFSNEKESMEVVKGNLIYADSENGLIPQNPAVENAKWMLWNRLYKNDVYLHLYTDFIDGSYKGDLISGQILKDSKERHFLSQGTISLPSSQGFVVGDEITMFGWVRLKEKSLHAPVLTKGDNTWRLQINHGRPHIGFGNTMYKSYLDSNVSLKTGEWYLIHQVIYQDRVEVYLNGEKITDEKVSDVSLNGNGVVMIGGNSNKKGLVFKGDIGEVGLFNKALSSVEVRDMFELGKFNN